MADSVKAAAAYYDVPLSCADHDVEEKLSDVSTLSTGSSTPQQAVEFAGGASNAHGCVTVGLLIPPFSMTLLSALLAVWDCGAASLVLPFPSAGELPVVDEKETASKAPAVFSRGGRVLVTYTTDVLAQTSIGSCVHSRKHYHNSKEPPSAHKGVDAFTRLWEYQLAESGCKLLVASSNIAAAAQRVSASLSLPLCIIDVSDDKCNGGQHEKKLFGRREEHKTSLLRVYVRDVPHDSAKASGNVKRWKALKEEAGTRMQKEHQPATPTNAFPRAAALFYEGSGIHSPCAVVYTHTALAQQVLRNKQLLELSSADTVLLFAVGGTIVSSLAGNAANTGKTNYATARLCSENRMTCAPKGLLTVALPAFAAGASLSIITSCMTDCSRHRGPAPVHVRRLEKGLQESQSQYNVKPTYGRLGTDAGHAAGNIRNDRASTLTPGYLTSIELWEAFAGMQTKAPLAATRTRHDDTFQTKGVDDFAKAQLDNDGISLLAMDLSTAAAMLMILRPTEKGLPHDAREAIRDEREDNNAAFDAENDNRDQRKPFSMPNSKQQCSETRLVSADTIRRYLAAARALRLVCICTDEEDLNKHFDCTRLRTLSSSTNISHVNMIVNGWQQLVSSRSKVLHLCSLTEVGLLFWDDGRRWKDKQVHDGIGEARYLDTEEGPKLQRAAGRTAVTSHLESFEEGLREIGGTVPHDLKAYVEAESGLLRIKSPHGALGYYNRPRSTVENFGIRGEFSPPYRGRVMDYSDKSDSAVFSTAIGHGVAVSSWPAVDHRITLQSSLYHAAGSKVPALYSLGTELRKGPKMERHIEGWVTKVPITGRDWCNLHAPQKHQKQTFR